MDFIKTENGFLENGIYTGLNTAGPGLSLSGLFLHFAGLFLHFGCSHYLPKHWKSVSNSPKYPSLLNSMQNVP